MFFDRKSAIKTFYYLISTTGDISSVKYEAFDEVGNQIDPEHYPEYQQELIDECESQLGTLIDEDDYYEVIQEGIYKAIQAADKDPELRVPTRLVIWDMFVIAFSDGNYSDLDRKLIKHVSRLMDLDRNIFLEMESMIKTMETVENELALLRGSDRPYSEIRPIVDETEKRRQNVQKSAQALIEDEVLFQEIEEEKKEPTKFEETRDKVVEKTKATAGVAKRDFVDAGKETIETVSEIGKGIAGTVTKFGKKLFGKPEDKSPKVEEKPEEISLDSEEK